MGAVFLFAIALAVYFLPSIIANSRKSSIENSVCVVNLFFGWTILGWFAALAMALDSRSGKDLPERNDNDPVDEPITDKTAVDDSAYKLIKLGEMRINGLLTDDEFQTQKQKILGQ